ncbi:MAG: acylglycerol kinase family protein, partial [Lachnospiraceae bacterium]|nr:acylglycerol kinase family protein [Lachnospiraceae bacterium]
MASTTAKTWYIIVNPASHAGKSRRIWGMLSAALKEREISYKAYLSAEPDDVTVLARKIIRRSDASPDNPAHIILLGGDGSLNELINGITDFSRVIVSYIPTGSGNDFARAHRYGSDPVKELDRILSSCPTLLDVGETEFADTDGIRRKKRFLISSGMGF